MSTKPLMVKSSYTPREARVVFSEYMQIAQKRKLTAHERQRLSMARQALRRARRPAMNPRRVAPWMPGTKVRAVARELLKHGYSREDALRFAKAFDDTVGIGSVKDAVERIVKSKTTMWRRVNPPKTTRRLSTKKVVKIYGKVLRIEAQKTGPHRCDAECRKCRHKYFHDFKAPARMLGLSPGDVLRVPAGCWPIVIMC